jgi:hypothetical protein
VEQHRDASNPASANRRRPTLRGVLWVALDDQAEAATNIVQCRERHFDSLMPRLENTGASKKAIRDAIMKWQEDLDKPDSEAAKESKPRKW